MIASGRPRSAALETSTAPVVRAALAGLAAGLSLAACGGSGDVKTDVKKDGAASAPGGAASPAPVVSGTDPSHEKKKDCCVGKNECKGKGGCKTDKNPCGGKNECKGQGGCSMRDCS